MAENKQAAPNSGDLATEVKSSAATTGGKKIHAKTSSRRGWYLSVFLLFFLALMIAANYWFFDQLRLLRQTQSDFVSQLQDQDQRLLNLDSHPSVTGLYEQQEEFQQGFNTRLENYDQQLAALDAASQRAYDAAMRSELDWSIAEIQYLFRLASYRLSLLDDVNGALAALKAADAALQRQADPALFALRKQLNDDMVRLSALQAADIPGIAIKLSGLMTQISGLEFNQKTDTNNGTTGDNDDGFWDKITSFVVVRRANETVTTNTQQDQEIRELMVYMLTASRAAALRGDEVEYQQQLSAVRQQLTDFFVQEHINNQSFLSGLDELQQSQLRNNNQDINASLKLLQEYTHKITSPVVIDKP